jgi:hypothetical protein
MLYFMDSMNDSISEFKIFDPLKNQFGDEQMIIYEPPSESPIYFSEELISSFN